MAFYGEADMAAALDDSGVVVSIADQWYTKGYIDIADDDLLIENNLGVFSGTVHVVTVMTDTLGPLLKAGTDITADGTKYAIYSVARKGDGAQTRIVVLRKS